MPTPTAAAIRAHYADDVASATDQQLAALILRRSTLGSKGRLATVLGAMAEDEAQTRGHDLPTFWALTTVGL